MGQLPESEEKHLRLKVKQLICDNLNGMRISSPCCSYTYARQERGSPGRGSSWELEFGIVVQSQGEGCCCLQKDRLRGCEGRDCGGKCLWRKARQPWKQGDTAESRVVGGAITIASLSLYTSIGS